MPNPNDVRPLQERGAVQPPRGIVVTQSGRVATQKPLLINPNRKAA